MPIEARIEKDRRRVRVDVWDEFTLDDMLSAIGNSVKHPDFEPGFDILSDHSGISGPMTVDQAKAMSARFEALSGVVAGTRWAAVVASPVSFGMMRMLSVLLEDVPMTVSLFETLADAEAWLADSDPGRSG